MESRARPRPACAVLWRALPLGGGLGPPGYVVVSGVGSWRDSVSCSWLELADRSVRPARALHSFSFLGQLLPKPCSCIRRATPETAVSSAWHKDAITLA